MKKYLFILLMFCTCGSFAEGKRKTFFESHHTHGNFIYFGYGFFNTKLVSIENPDAQRMLNFKQSLGVTANLEFGNQWSFYNNEKFGIGLKASWLQIGYSNYIKYTNNNNQKGFGINLKTLKVGPNFVYTITDDLSLESSFAVEPTAYFYAIPGRSVTGGYGIGYAPSLRLRYKTLTLGGEYTYEKLKSYNSFDTEEKITGTTESKVLYSGVRIYFGFNF